MNETVKRLNIFFSKRKIYNIILSISGGVDSVTLLSILLDVKSINKDLKIHLYHINYNAHNKSNEAEILCNFYSDKYNLPIYIDSVNIGNKNFESRARNLRYNNLKKIITEYNIDLILTGHTYDDQIETLIMKDLENADWVSMLGIRTFNKDIYRPLLNISKINIYDYAKNTNLSWIEDPSNQCDSFKRNKIRNQLKNNHFSIEYIDSLIKIQIESCHSIEKFRSEYKSTFVKHISKNINNSLLIDSKLVEFINDYITMKLCISKFIKIINEEIVVINTKSHWKNLYKFMLTSKQGSLFIIFNNIFIQKDRNNFILYVNKSVNKDLRIRLKKESVNWYGTSFDFYKKETFKSGYNARIPLKLFDDGLFLTHWKYGDKLLDNGMNKKISDIFINNKISNYDKKFYPIIRDNSNNILWIPNILDNFEFSNNNILYAEWNI